MLSKRKMRGMIPKLWLAMIMAGGSCLPLSALSQSLFITGLPCPGGEGEPTNAHPLIWTGGSSWRTWTETVQIRYGDFVAVTWYDQCRAHSTSWQFARLDLVYANGSATLQTNSATISIQPGYNFSFDCIYWFTNGSDLFPTNFSAAQAAVRISNNQTPVLAIPALIRGSNISPPLWFGANLVTNAADLQCAPAWITNADGGMIVNPALQLPFWLQEQSGVSIAALTLHGLPGVYTIQTNSNLFTPWLNGPQIAVEAEGSGAISIPREPGADLFVRARSTNPELGLGYNVLFQTEGSAFEPAIYCENNQPQDFGWQWADGTTGTNRPLALKDFGAPATRTQRLRVLAPETITTINLGFDGSDGGDALPLSNRPPQEVSRVLFPYPLTSLRYWASSYNPLTNGLDFTGFTSLEDVECWHCTNLQHVAVANLPALKRVCFEQCGLQELNLRGLPNLEDVRAALNDFSAVRVGGGTGPKIWHWCVRDNPQLTQDFNEIMTNFFSLRELWIWNANQSGALTVVSSNFTDVELQNNAYTSANFSGQTNLQILWIFNNSLTNLLVHGCGSLQDLEAEQNQLPRSALDSILAFLDASAPDLQILDLTGNAEFPSPAGYAHYTNLLNRGVAAYVDFPTNGFPFVVLDSNVLVGESCLPTNNAVDPGETVTLTVALKNIGALDTTNLTATLLATSGITPLSGAQNYGSLPAGGPAASAAFTFRADGSCGSTVMAHFQLEDSGVDFGVVTIPIKLGPDSLVWGENFDSVTPPDLPIGWSTASLSNAPVWVTANSGGVGSNTVFCTDADSPDIAELVSPPIDLPSAPSQLSFQNSYDLEPGYPGTADDGGVLEMKIGTNAFTDIVAAGGAFAMGGYVATITNIWGNPLAGRRAWTGDSGGFIITRVDLPASAQGQTVRFRWRCGTDQGNSGAIFNGWKIDKIEITGSVCCTNSQPVPLGAPGRKRLRL